MAYLGRRGGAAALTSADIPDNSITSAKIGVDVIVAEDIANNAITVAEIADDAVTADKLANSINTDIATGVAALPKAGGTMTGSLNTVGITNTTGASDMATFVTTAGNRELILKSTAATGNNTIAGIRWQALDSSNANETWAGIAGIVTDNTNGVEDGALVFQTVGGGTFTERMRIDSGGNVAIAKENPAAHLDVGNTTTYNHIGKSVIRIGSINDANVYALYGCGWGGGGTYSPVTFGGLGSSGSGSVMAHFVINTRGSTSDIGPTERMRITDGGEVHIGTTVVQVSSSTGQGVTIGRHSYSTFAVNSGVCVYMNRTGNSDGAILHFRKDGVNVGSISTNANNLPSDLNFKRDIDDLDLGLELVNKLNPKAFRYKVSNDESPKMYGLIAQEIEVALEECGVVKNSATLLQHEPTEEENQSDYSLDYLKLTPILINSVKELSAKNDALEARILTLENA